ncbi:HAD family hydrolase [Marinimicrobium sp. ABcell2]|uniref:HAD family hydrolase n=1 Tax=Marinimicrobium sp. ABcell2 TaxID=3069751 RepID=UPI0027B1D64F|nr:HAD-IA family hydrolase [Marinimicrobium sp. ABcell2]MDQ2076902.1 HAD-IA family hydrolase [Marinimicrobium sp. ABcell2]
MKHGIIFDCDGTLVDSLSQALESFNHALAAVGEQPRSPEQIKAYFGAGADRILMRIIGDEAKGMEAFQHYVEHQSNLAGATRLHKGVRELLDTLAEQGVPMAVVTGRHERDLQILLEPHQLSEYFVTLIADNHAPQSKPAPDGVLMAAERMGLEPEHTLYVGDAIYDLQAAHAAGSIPVAALWDVLAKPDELRAENPAFMAQTARELWPFFKQRWPLNHH